MDSQHQENARVFKAFCDEKRLAILELLQDGEKCACVLIDALGIGQSGLSYHMKILCDSGVVEARQEGKWTHYQISEPGRAAALSLLKAVTATKAQARQDSCACHTGPSL